MVSFLVRSFDLRPNEYRRFWIMAGYVFVVIASYNVLKPMTRSLFVSSLGPEQLPILFMILAAVVALFITVYLRISARVRLDKLVAVTTLVLTASLLLFWWLLKIELSSPLLYYGLYIWASIYGVLTTTQFWLMANYVFNLREAKRLFPLLTSAGLLGGIMGGYFTRFLVKTIGGTENLAFVCIGMLVIAFILIGMAWKNRDDSLETSRQGQSSKQATQSLRVLSELSGLIRGSRHLLFLVLIVALTYMVVQIADFQFIAFAAEEMTDKDELTGFLGFWLSNLSIFALLFQLLFSNAILNRLGVGGTILFLPVALLVTSFWVLLSYGLIPILAIKIGDGAFRHSINKVGMELMYLPVPSEVKKKTKAFIDMFVDRFARGAAGLVLLIAYSWLGLSIAQLSLLTIALVLIWIVLSIATEKEYVNSFRQAIARRRINIDEVPAVIKDDATINSLLLSLASRNDRQVVYALRVLKAVTGVELEPPVRPLLQHPSQDVRLHALRLIYDKGLQDLLPDVEALLQDPDPDVRREAVKLAIEFSQGTADRQINAWLHSKDTALRGATLRYLAEKPALANRFITHEVIASFMQEGPEGRAELAHTLGTLRSKHYLPYLRALLQDPDSDVKRLAIESVGRSKEGTLVQPLVDLLGERAFRKAARESLALFGTDVTGIIDGLLRNGKVSFACKAEMARVLGRIGSQESVETLLNHIAVEHESLRYQIIKALNKLRANFPDLDFDDRVDAALIAECDKYYRLMVSLHLANGPEDGNSGSLLHRSIQERLDDHLERIFRLLGLRYPPRDIYNAFAATTSKDKGIRASAIEFLDNILSKNHRSLLLPMVEEMSLDQIQVKANRDTAATVASRQEALGDLLQSQDMWLQAYTIYEIGKNGMIAEFLPDIEKAKNSDDVVLRETAELVLQRFAGRTI